MNIPTQVTTGATSSFQIAAARTMLIYLAVTNNGASTRFYSLVDVGGVPGVGVVSPNTQGVQFQAAPGQTIKLPPVDSPQAIAFSTGCRLMAFTDSALTVAAPSDSAVVAWTAALA